MLARAIVAVDTKKVEFRGDIEIGAVGDWDVRVELEASAISVGTESYVLANFKNLGWTSNYIPGYAPVGRIVELGEKASSSFRLGERISYFSSRGAVNVPPSCGGHLSPAIIDVDPAKRDLLGPDQYVVKVPETLSSERAAFGGISAVSCMGVSMPKPEVGDKVLVIGQGMIGQFAAQHFKLRGCEVCVADLHDKRLQLSKQSGADHVVNSTGGKLVESVKAIWPNGADIVCDTTGSFRVVEESVPLCRRRGKYVFLGWCKGDCALTRFHGHIYEAYFPWTLEGKRVAAAWRLMDIGALKVDHLITHRFKASDAQKAYDLIYTAPQEYVGIALDWTK